MAVVGDAGVDADAAGAAGAVEYDDVAVGVADDVAAGVAVDL